MIRILTPDDVAARLNAVRDYALTIPAANGKIGVVGYCWGGSQSFNYAVAQPQLDAAVAYYGTALPIPRRLRVSTLPCLVSLAATTRG